MFNPIKKMRKMLARVRNTTTEDEEKNRKKIIEMLLDLKQDMEIEDQNNNLITPEKLTDMPYPDLIDLLEEVITTIEAQK